MNSLPPEPVSSRSMTKEDAHVDEQALDFARRAASLKRTEQVCTIVGFGSLFLSLPVMFVLQPLLGIPMSSWECAAIMPFAFGGLIAGVVVSTMRSAMMREARDTRDKRKVGILLDVYMEFYNISSYSRANPSRPSRWRPKVKEFSDLLSILLPRLEEGDSALLSPKQRSVLRSLLQQTDSTPSLVAATLGALEKIGNSADLPVVEKLARGEWQAAEDQHLRHMAEETSASIRRRLAELSQPATLLRAASAKETTQDALLHPATSASSDAEANKLLRPGDNDTVQKLRDHIS